MSDLKVSQFDSEGTIGWWGYHGWALWNHCWNLKHALEAGGDIGPGPRLYAHHGILQNVFCSETAPHKFRLLARHLAGVRDVVVLKNKKYREGWKMDRAEGKHRRFGAYVPDSGWHCARGTCQKTCLWF
jgi:hypothetical protein